MALLVKLAIISKTEWEASLLGNACISSSSPHSSRKTAISNVCYLSVKVFYCSCTSNSNGVYKNQNDG